MATCDLYDIWAKACNHYDIPEDNIRSWYERIKAKLSEDETKRVYHNWSCMLAHKRPELERAKPHIVLAAFFQYYEFELDKNCSKENCAVFREFCRDTMIEDEEMKQTVCRLLGEKPTNAITSDIDDDVAILQDLDLLILASAANTYKIYAELSRQEWLNAGKTNYDILRHKPHNDDTPTSSTPVSTTRKNSWKNKFSRSPYKPVSAKRLKQIHAERVRRLIARSRLMMHDKHKVLHGKQDNQNYLNPSYLNTTTRKNGKITKKSKCLHESEKMQLMTKASSTKKQESDDDCFIVEQFPSHVTILDDDYSDDEDSDDNESANDNNNIADRRSNKNNAQSKNQTIADENCSYEAFLKSFAPCEDKVSQPDSHTNAGSTPITIKDARNHVFVDVARDVYLNKPIYNTIAPLTVRSQAVNEKRDESVVIVEDVSMTDNNVTTLRQESNENVSTSSSEEEDDSSSEEEVQVGKKVGETEDDSVIFISSTNSNDFIAISDENKKPENKCNTTSKTNCSTPTNQHYSNLLNKNEKRELQMYNFNTYNPNAGKVLTAKKRMVIIDGSNVAFKHSADQQFSVKGLSIAIEYFQKMGHEVKAVIPQYRMNPYKSTDPNELMRLHKAGFIVPTPCKNLPGLTSSSYDDRFVLQLASEMDAAIVSNDNYRDLIHENAAFKKIIETRVIGYTWCNDMFILPKDPYGKWGPTLPMILYRS